MPQPNRHLSEITLPIYEDYVSIDEQELAGKNMINRTYVVPKGKARMTYRLNQDQYHNDFALVYSEIDDRQSALKWCRAFGLPINDDRVALDEMLESAASVRWLMIMIDAVRSNTLSEYAQSKETDKDIIFTFRSASEQRHNYRGVYGTEFNRYVRFAPDNIGNYEHFIPRSLADEISYPIEEKRRFSQDALRIFAAKEYLRLAFNSVLTGVLPALIGATILNRANQIWYLPLRF